jgi:hypothetical protein
MRARFADTVARGTRYAEQAEADYGAFVAGDQEREMVEEAPYHWGTKADRGSSGKAH